MQIKIKINLASASLKDAEHAIFIIGAYFGMTNLPTVGQFVRTGAPASVADMVGERLDAATLIHTGADVQVFPDGSAAVIPGGNGVPPVAIPPAPVEPSAAEVFGGNVPPSPAVPIAAAPVGIPAAPAPAPVASVAPVGVELDAEGLPWDARINALGDGGVHPKNANGNWRAKRGLNDGALVARVKEELRQTLAAGRPPVAAIPPGPVVPVASPTAPPVAVLPPAPPAAPSAPVGPPTTFEMLMPRVTPVVAAGHLPPTALHAAATAYGLPNALALTQRPDLVPTVWLYLQSICPQLQ